MQLGSNYDVAHAKGLGFAALRTKHAQREREAAEMKRKAQGKKVKEGETRTEDKSEDDGDNESEQWNAICVAGLKVYSHDPELQLELRQHPALDLKTNAKSMGGSSCWRPAARPLLWHTQTSFVLSVGCLPWSKSWVQLGSLRSENSGFQDWDCVRNVEGYSIYLNSSESFRLIPPIIS